MRTRHTTTPTGLDDTAGIFLVSLVIVSLGDTLAPSPISSPTRLPLPPVGNVAVTLFRDTVAAGGLGTIRYNSGILRGFVALRYAECRPLWFALALR